MGTAQLQGGLWAERAYYWATLMERNELPFFETVLMKLALDSTTALLDIACGTGQFVQMAALHGAQISGIDASAASIEIARQRVPSGTFAIGEMEELPYADHSFDAVTGFNAFQYAATPVHALQEARRVTKPGGKVAILWFGANHRIARRMSRSRHLARSFHHPLQAHLLRWHSLSQE